MPDKTTPQIEKAAQIIDPEAFGLPNTFHQPDEDGFVLSDRDEARAKAEAILSSHREGAEAMRPVTDAAREWLDARSTAIAECNASGGFAPGQVERLAKAEADLAAATRALPIAESKTDAG